VRAVSMMIGTSQGSGHVKSVELWQREVEDDQVWPPGACRSKRSLPIRSNEHGEPTVLEVVADELDDSWLVVHDQDGRHRVHRRDRNSTEGP